MTKGDLDAIRLWGRPLKPVALGLSFYMLVLVVYNGIGIGVLGDTLVAHATLVLASVSFVSLIGGWVFKSQHMAEVGLFSAGLAAVLRSVFVLMMEGPSQIGIWLGMGVAVVALGSFLLERADESAAAWRS